MKISNKKQTESPNEGIVQQNVKEVVSSERSSCWYKSKYAHGKINKLD